MKKQKRGWKRKAGAKQLLMFCLSLCLLTPQTVLASEGTQGTEIQVLEPESLKIQLGTAWTGVEFQLKTDAGLYPGTIPVGEDGVLCLEIGGSKSYILTCLDSPKEAPKSAQAPATTEGNIKKDENGEAESMDMTEGLQQNPDLEEHGQNPKEAAREDGGTGIPVLHIVLFFGGMTVSIGILIALHLFKKGQDPDGDYDLYDEE